MDSLKWFKSSFSGNGQSCVECAHLPDGGMAVRDTKDRDGGTLHFTAQEWRAFVAEANAGKLDRDAD